MICQRWMMMITGVEICLAIRRLVRIAILAGDALSARAFEIIVNDNLLDSNTKIRLIKVLADAVGINGMIGGQALDIKNEQKKDLNEDDLIQICLLKTGALLRAACKMGCIIAGADEKKIMKADEFAKNIGLAFQIVDDVLDVTGTQELLGKPIGSIHNRIRLHLLHYMV